MAKAYKPPIVISLRGFSKKQKKQVVKVLTRDVVKNKKYRKTLDQSETPIPRKVAKSAARAAVVATLESAREQPTALERYTDLVGKFSVARKKYKIKQKRRAKVAKKAGYNPATGLYALQKLPRVKLAKRAKTYKAKKRK